MANWGIVIGINQYERLNSLKYAERDAQLMRDFFIEYGFEQVVYFSDDSNTSIETPDGDQLKTIPKLVNLESFFREFFSNEKPPLAPGDNLWFFFSGHGLRYKGKDYLVPSDGSPNLIERTTIALSTIRDNLLQSGADNIMLFLDACRNENDFGSRSGLGTERQKGIITISSCSPKQESYEISDLGQGSFTYALLEGLRLQGANNCATVQRLIEYLIHRVPELNQKYNKPKQNPYSIIEPSNKSHFILLPQQANVEDIKLLKYDALVAKDNENYELAEQLWIRVLAISPTDRESLNALKKIWLDAINKKYKQSQKLAQDLESQAQALDSKVQELIRELNNKTQAQKKYIEDLQQTEKQLEIQQSSYEENLKQVKSKLQEEIQAKNTKINSLTASLEQLEEEKRSLELELKKTKQQLEEISKPPQTSINNSADKIPLKSDRNIDYTRLRDLLADKEWEAADKETAKVMSLAAGKEENDFLFEEDIKNFPCTDLKTIDSLWVHYSNGKFGFSVQKNIYQKLGGTKDYNEEIWDKFYRQVEWNNVRYELNISTTTGNLPYYIFGPFGVVGDIVRLLLFSRIQTCNL